MDVRQPSAKSWTHISAKHRKCHRFRTFGFIQESVPYQGYKYLSISVGYLLLLSFDKFELDDEQITGESKEKKTLHCLKNLVRSVTFSLCECEYSGFIYCPGSAVWQQCKLVFGPRGIWCGRLS